MCIIEIETEKQFKALLSTKDKLGVEDVFALDYYSKKHKITKEDRKIIASLMDEITADGFPFD